jgi:hypothetical protein
LVQDRARRSTFQDKGWQAHAYNAASRDANVNAEARSGGQVLQVQLTINDYLAAVALHARWTLDVWIRLVSFTIAAIGFGLYFWWVPNSPAKGGGLAVIALALIYLVFLLYNRYVAIPRRARRIFAQQNSLQRPYTWSWDDDSMRFSSDLVSAVIPWTDIMQWRESKTLFTVYSSDIVFYAFPKRAFTDATAIVAFRELLRSRIVSTGWPQAAF